LEILTYPHPTLRHKSKPLRKVDAELKQLVGEMFELMYANKGIGLAANQVVFRCGSSFSTSPAKRGKGRRWSFSTRSFSFPKGSEEAEEGLPEPAGAVGNVIRPKASAGECLLARMARNFTPMSPASWVAASSHETDHLDGVLFTDRMNPPPAPTSPTTSTSSKPPSKSRRATGGILSDEQIAAQLAELERK